jgi:XTP/dITP diphosphohydrolase
MTVRAVLATRNRHKMREIQVLLREASLPFTLVAIDEVAPLTELREDEPTFEANALAKAEQAAVSTGLPAIADDSGIEVDFLGGAPGVRSARWAGEPCDDVRNNEKLLRALDGVPAPERTARYRCAAAFVDPDRNLKLVASGACEGQVLDVPRGGGGFGYDPLVWLPAFGRSMAEITPEEKNTISHRAIAFRSLARMLREVSSRFDATGPFLR